MSSRLEHPSLDCVFISLTSTTTFKAHEMLDAIRKYGLSAVVVLLVIFTSHAFYTLHLHFTHNGFYVLFLLCFFISYYRACVVEPGYVSSNDAESRVHEWERKSDGSRRFCRKCRLFKPGGRVSYGLFSLNNTVTSDRTHHCSSCSRCVYKMDHHCPWCE